MGITKAQRVVAMGKPTWVFRRFSQYDKQWLGYILMLLALDGFAVWCSLSLAYRLWINRDGYIEPAGFDFGSYFMLKIISIPLFWLIYAMAGLYDRNNLMGGVTEYGRILPATVVGTIMMMVTAFVLRETFISISRGWLLLSLAFITAMVGVQRFTLRQIGRWCRYRLQWLTAKTLIVGANDQGVAMARQWHSTSHSGLNVIGFLDDFKPIGTSVVDNIAVIGRPTQLQQIARDVDAHEVMVVWNAVAWETFEEIIRTAGLPKEYTLRLSPGFYDLLTTSVTVTNNTVVPLLTINEARIVGMDAMLKTLFDYGLTLASLIVTAPLMGLIALCLKLSGKPILARYPTIGQGGTVFDMFKFQTGFTAVSGSISSHERTTQTWQAEQQPSRIERALYYTGLDKLPQLFNVLLHQMSLVGPRPRVMGGAQADIRATPHLQAVRPGLIGPWSIQQYLDPTDELRDDMHYVRSWEISLDVRVLLVTLAALGRISRVARPRWMHEKSVI